MVGGIFVSCNNNLPPTWWLTTTRIHSFTILQTSSPESRCWQSHTPCRGSKRATVLCLFQLLVAAGIPGLEPTPRQSPLPSSHCLLLVYVSVSVRELPVSLAYKDMCDYNLRPLGDPRWIPPIKTLNLIAVFAKWGSFSGSRDLKMAVFGEAFSAYHRRVKT